MSVKKKPYHKLKNIIIKVLYNIFLSYIKHCFYKESSFYNIFQIIGIGREEHFMVFIIIPHSG